VNVDVIGWGVIDRANCFRDSLEHHLRVGLRAHDEIRADTEDLIDARVDSRGRHFVDGTLSYIAHQSDDRIARGVAERQHLADWTPSGKIPFRECLIDDEHQGRALPVLRRQIASSEDWNAHRVEEAVAREHQRRSGRGFGGGFWLSCEHEGNRLAVTAERQVTDRAGGDHAWHLPHALEHLSVCLAHVRGARMPRRRDGVVERDAVFRSEAEIHLHELHEATRHQPCADDEHHRQRDFRDDECAAQPA